MKMIPRRLEIHYQTRNGTKCCMAIYPEKLFPMTRAKLKKLDKVVQMDEDGNHDVFWMETIEILKSDAPKWLDGQIEAYDRIAESRRWVDESEYKEVKAVANSYRRAKKKLKGNIEFIERNFINDRRK